VVDSAVAPTVTSVPTPTAQPHEPITYSVAPDADQSVKEFLADGIVTREEYGQAVANSMACLDDKGVSHSEPVYNAARVQYDYVVQSTSAPGGVSAYDD
jgi:hypothetical protein